ncbi:hypothetical protein [Clostridium cellulovorans]|uniref:Uncharacterized protein n=1 Tax=Clostridium cellulovorans (strain ATCC 35296 / DSM 3052 / OCM 3 / 743B) TaxID=573061 RepID=D9SWX4_CLOC7|nr:hypothetical protein [Clostridium cellulovorans]ADL51335.1 hypothetical protein Clocel_1588 [Clostridium cellulovorans 743B]
MFKEVFNYYAKSYYEKMQKRIIQYEIDTNDKKRKQIDVLREQQEIISNMEKLEESKKIMELDYANTIRHFKDNGVVWEIKRYNLPIKEWDNLFLEKTQGQYYIVTAEKQKLYSFDKEDSFVLGEILKEYNYNIVVIAVESRNIKVQFRLRDL